MVTLARSGYYQVKFDQELDDKRSSVFFRGKELWRTADGEPPPPEVLKELPGRTAPAPRPASQFSLAERGFGYDGGGGAGGGVGGDGWLMDLGIERGQRKRKPTQLYDAETGGHAELISVPAGVIGCGGGGHWCWPRWQEARSRRRRSHRGGERSAHCQARAVREHLRDGAIDAQRLPGDHRARHPPQRSCQGLLRHHLRRRPLAGRPSPRAAHMSSSAPTYHPPLRDSTTSCWARRKGEAATMAARAAPDPSCRARATRLRLRRPA